jgi:16S rRNA (cytidine1402-2'-O)-methyltransferase
VLYICPTPIGNLEDITLRVLEALRKVDLIAAEDTRRTMQLLTHFSISKPLVSFFEHNEVVRSREIINRLRMGDSVALVSDAGMPGICDPGYRLIQAVVDEGLQFDVLPGPSAVETALVSSGFATDSFLFLGYLPRRRGDLKQVLARISAESSTCVAFETPHRLAATLRQAEELLGERRIAVCRELTKKFQEIKRGSAAALAAALPEKVRGEIVLVFEGAQKSEAAEEPDLAAVETALGDMLAAGVSARLAAGIAAQLTSLPRNRAYELALQVRKATEA